VKHPGARTARADRRPADCRPVDCHPTDRNGDAVLEPFSLMTHPPGPAPDDAPSAPVLALGEIALRTERLPEMVAFYRDVVGLTPIEVGATNAFFTLGESAGGHAAVFVLFDRSGDDDYTPTDPARTTLDHLAFTVARDAFDAEAERLTAAGLALDFAYHDWVRWRSLYFDDPDGNRVEFVCYDAEGAADAGAGTDADSESDRETTTP
jgi:catechol 2,3-dioxygenase-like lactoylglutathione lyase family enzyme